MDFIYLTNLTSSDQPVRAFDGDMLILPARASSVRVEAKFGFSINEQVVSKTDSPIGNRVPTLQVAPRQGE